VVALQLEYILSGCPSIGQTWSIFSVVVLHLEYILSGSPSFGVYAQW
jgi:hypothetical protein